MSGAVEALSNVLSPVSTLFEVLVGQPKAPDAPMLLTTPAKVEAEAEAKARADMEILRKQQRGAAATMLTTTSQSGKSLLGG